jgi:phage-related protein
MIAPADLVNFWRSSAGREPVREWLNSLAPEDRDKIGDDLRRVQFRWPLGTPMCRPMGHGLTELRTSLSGREARVLFTVREHRIIVLHAFIKKTRTTQDQDLTLARQRLENYK